MVYHAYGSNKTYFYSLRNKTEDVISKIYLYPLSLNEENNYTEVHEGKKFNEIFGP